MCLEKYKIWTDKHNTHCIFRADSPVRKMYGWACSDCNDVLEIYLDDFNSELKQLEQERISKLPVADKVDKKIHDWAIDDDFSMTQNWFHE
jgi:hypothetical protein